MKIKRKKDLILLKKLKKYKNLNKKQNLSYKIAKSQNKHLGLQYLLNNLLKFLFNKIKKRIHKCKCKVAINKFHKKILQISIKKLIIL